MRKYDQNEFIEKCMNIHKNYSYNYDKVEYINNDTKVIITCLEHGDFYITPKNILKGQKCKKCGYKYRDNRSSNTIDFIDKCKKIHSDLYDYSFVNYKNARSKIQVVCKLHGPFYIIATNHLNGKQGCKECSKYSVFKRSEWTNKCKNKSCTFYIIKCWNDKESFYKFGITSRDTKKRFAGILMPYNYEIVKEVKSKDAGYIWDLERRFKRLKIKNKYVPNIKFAGTTECFK